jgi:hypothetical protein
MFIGMERKILTWALWVALILPQTAEAQQEPAESVQDAIERSSENFEGNNDLSELEEQFTLRRDINRAGAEELLNIPGLTLSNVLAILIHRQRFGPFLSLEELQVLPGFDAAFIRSVQPWLECRSPDQLLWYRLKKGMHRGKHEFLLYGLRNWPQADKRYALPDSAVNRFLGDPFRSHIRYRYQVPGLLSVGWAAEKDPGERWVGQSGLMDFNSLHVFVEHTGLLRRLALGDFQYNCGQGLLLGTGLGFSQSALVMQIKRNASGIRPFRSVNESRYLRGFAIGVAKGAWQADVLFSSRRVSTRMNLDSLRYDAPLDFRLDLDGLHRTTAEIEGRRKALEQLGGLNVVHRTASGRLGAALRYNRNGLDTGSATAWSYGNTSLSVYGDRTWRNFHFFFEESRNAISLTVAHARVIGLLASLHNSVDMSLLYRKYSSSYDAASGSGFGQFSSNETGLYFGFQWRPIARWTVSAYQDYWQRPLPSYRNNAPTRGSSRLLECSYAPSRNLVWYVRIRMQENSRNNISNRQQIAYPVQETVYHLRFHADYPIGKNLEMASRLEYSSPGGKQFSGSLVFQDMQWKPAVGGWRLGARWCIFHIPSFNARIFAYENDLPQVFSVRGFQGKGRSMYVLVQRPINRHLRLYLRFARFRYDDAMQAQTTFSGLIRFQI